MKTNFFIILAWFLIQTCTSQTRYDIDICDKIDQWPAVMEFIIPKEKCELVDKAPAFVLRAIRKTFSVNSSLVEKTILKLDNYYVCEFSYFNQECDTNSVLYILDMNNGNTVLRSAVYNTDVNRCDVRYRLENNLIVFYRKIVNNGSPRSLSIQFRRSDSSIACFIDDGFSEW